MYPERDDQFEETTIAKVEHYAAGGWGIERADGWSFGVQKDSPIEPVVGMKARFYGKGVGSSVRGLFLNGVKVYYRTEAEDKEHQSIQLFGADAADWLARWDDGKTVWSIEMGGMGPGYEQALQITIAEVLRHLLAEKYDAQRWEIPELWKDDREAIYKYGMANAVIGALGLSGAQWGAAVQVATALYRDGPRALMDKPELKDRHIQVSKTFPQAVAA